jgi:hydroxyacylglutathione hydrolase
VIGGKDCKKVTRTPKHGETFNIGSIAVEALHTPCHTQDSICWFMQDGDERAVFTGDTLFHGGRYILLSPASKQVLLIQRFSFCSVPGCGKFFEGTGEEMHKALNVTLASLPDDTRLIQDSL